MELLTDPDIWIAFLTLTVLEIVLGIDNVVFISILADKLPEHERARARRLGLVLAMIMRVLLLLASPGSSGSRRRSSRSSARSSPGAT
ncbi:MAG: hypothetical protein QOF04_3114 [Solirubrobacteraceae bacterium]|jgi:predicted tellurium resistance membrane protein TerC|nr:hypothetical protein [Solirubrobacteraceae bacterium]